VSGSESTNGIVFYILAALVGMAVGFVTVWSQIRNQSRTAKQDMEAAKTDLEKRIRDYLNLKLDNIQMQIKHVKEDIARLDKKINNNRNRQQQEDSFQ
jgi:TolA-binding protein